MDQLAKEDIAAAAAAHQELGPHFDGAVAESLVERIGAEIDKRVDQRMGEAIFGLAILVWKHRPELCFAHLSEICNGYATVFGCG